jgi:hypothetical protein
MSVTDRSTAYADDAVDDLPRTLRREREARERAQQPLGGGTSQLSSGSSTVGFVPEPTWPTDTSIATPAVVTAFDVPFTRLVMFCMKLVFAAIPALILLTVILWGLGQLLMTYFPWLVKVQILIRVPN